MALLESRVALTCNAHDRDLTREELLGLVKGQHGVISMLTDRLDAEVFDAAPNLKVVSTDAASQTVTVQLAPGAAGGVAAVPGQAETIPAGATRILGPFAKARFDQSSAGDVHFDPSVSTTLKFRAYRVAKAV